MRDQIVSACLGDRPEPALVDALGRRGVPIALGASIIATDAPYAEPALAAEQRAGLADAAAERAGHAAQLAGAVGHRHLEGRALTTLAAGYLGQGAGAHATEQAERALAIHRETGCRLEQAVTLHLLGLAADGSERAGYHEQARDLLIELGITDREQQQRLVQPAELPAAAG